MWRPQFYRYTEESEIIQIINFVSKNLVDVTQPSPLWPKSVFQASLKDNEQDSDRNRLPCTFSLTHFFLSLKKRIPTSTLDIGVLSSITLFDNCNNQTYSILIALMKLYKSFAVAIDSNLTDHFVCVNILLGLSLNTSSVNICHITSDRLWLKYKRFVEITMEHRYGLIFVREGLTLSIKPRRHSVRWRNWRAR